MYICYPSLVSLLNYLFSDFQSCSLVVIYTVCLPSRSHHPAQKGRAASVMVVAIVICCVCLFWFLSLLSYIYYYNILQRGFFVVVVFCKDVFWMGLIFLAFPIFVVFIALLFDYCCCSMTCFFNLMQFFAYNN